MLSFFAPAARTWNNYSARICKSKNSMPVRKQSRIMNLDALHREVEGVHPAHGGYSLVSEISPAPSRRTITSARPQYSGCESVALKLAYPRASPLPTAIIRPGPFTENETLSDASPERGINATLPDNLRPGAADAAGMEHHGVLAQSGRERLCRSFEQRAVPVEDCGTDLVRR